MATILVIEDDVSWSSILKRILEKQSYNVICVTSCSAAKDHISGENVDLALVDVSLTRVDRKRDLSFPVEGPSRKSSESECVPGEEGFHLTAWIQHHHPEIGTIILTDRTHIDDQIYGRDLGADDYALKPILEHDLLSRVRSLLRRLGSKQIDQVVFGNWEYSVLDSTLTRIGSVGTPLKTNITTSEIRALNLLVKRIGSVVSRKTLCWQIFNRELGDKDRSVDNVLSKLRGKLDSGLEGKGSHISTVHGSGYRLESFVAGRY